MKKNMIKNVLIAGSVFMLTTLTACSTTGVSKQSQHYRKANEISQEGIREQAIEVEKNNVPVFMVDNGVYLDAKPLITKKESTINLPPVFSKQFSYRASEGMSIQDVGNTVSRLTNVPVFIARDVAGGGSSGGGTSATADSTSVGGAAPSESSGGSDGGMSISNLKYNGNLKGFFDYLTAKTQSYWRWDGRTVQVFAFETKVFKIDTLPGKVNSSSSVNSGGQGSSTGTQGSSSSSVAVSSDSDVWKEIETQLKSVMSSTGKLTITQSTGLITVTDAPESIRQVERQIRELDAILSKQVLVNVEVYSIETNNGDNFSTNLNLVFSQLSNQFNLGFAGAATAVTGGGVLTGTFVDPGNKFNGSTALISALNTIGKASLVTNASLLTLNGQSVPLNVTRTRNYLKSTKVTAGPNGAAPSVELTDGQVTEGFVINLLPRITDSKNLYMQYSIDISQIEGIETFSSGPNTIQLPTTNTRNFLQRVGIRSGETLMLAGFKQFKDEDKKSGFLHPDNWFIPGGSKVTNAQETTLVVLITPYVIGNRAIKY